MKPSIRTYICCCVLISIFSLLMLPQEASAARKKKVEVVEVDTLPLFRGIQVNYDLAGTIIRLASDYGQYEVAGKVNLKDRFFPIVEVGYGSSDHATDAITGIHARCNAPYYRIGCDYNIAKNKSNGYRVLAGLRYGLSFFSFDADATTTDPVWGAKSQWEIHETGLSYHWLELVFGVDAKIWGPLHLGWSFRYKIPVASNIGNSGSLWYIPGFGEYGNKLNGTFNVGFEF